MNNGNSSVQNRMQTMLLQKDYKGLAVQCVNMGFTVEALQSDKTKAAKFQEVFKDHAKPIFQEMLLLHQAALYTANQMKQMNQYKQQMGGDTGMDGANLLMQQSQKKAGSQQIQMQQSSPGVQAHGSPVVTPQNMQRIPKPALGSGSTGDGSSQAKPSAAVAAMAAAQTPKEKLSAQFLYLNELLVRLVNGDINRERGFQFISCFLRIVTATKNFQYQPTEKERLIWSQAQQAYNSEAFLPIRKEFELVFKQQQQQKEAAQMAFRAQSAQPAGAAAQSNANAPALPANISAANMKAVPPKLGSAVNAAGAMPRGMSNGGLNVSQTMAAGAAKSNTLHSQFVVPQHASFNPAPQLSSKLFSLPTHGGSQIAIGAAAPANVGLSASANASVSAVAKRKRDLDPETREKAQLYNEESFLLRSRLEELLLQMDPEETFEPETLDLLLEVADDFIEQVVSFGCKLAKHRGSSKLSVKDLQVMLERNYNIRVPGYSSDLSKAVRKSYSLLYPTPTAKYRDNLAVVKSTIQQEIDDEANLEV